jgi:hypothetical protein
MMTGQAARERPQKSLEFTAVKLSNIVLSILARISNEHTGYVGTDDAVAAIAAAAI